MVIPDSVTSINNYSFDGDKSLAHIDLHEGITKIGWQIVFGGCNSLKELRIPSTLVIDGYEFSSAPALETVYVPDGWTELPAKAFINCEHLKKAVIPESVTKINTLAFSRCYELETIDAPRDEYELENGAFTYCNNLWDERFSIAKEGDLFITKSSPSNSAGDITNYTVYYSINPRFLDTFGTAHLDVGVQPWKHLVIDESLPDGLTAGDVGFKLDLGSPTGVFRFSVRNPEDATVKVNAEFSAKTFTPESYEWDTKQLAITDTEFDLVSINAPDTVSANDGKSSFSVYGYAHIGEKVSILVNGEEKTIVDSNKYTGKYSAQIEYETSDSVITVQAVCDDKKSDKKSISIDPAMPVLVDFDVTHYTHGTDHWTKDMTDMFKTGYSPYVPINPGRPFEFDVKLDNDDNTDNVFVFSDTNGKVSCVPLENEPKTERWKGTGSFDSTIPGDLYIGQAPKSESGVAQIKVADDGRVSLEKDGTDLLSAASKNNDPVKEVAENGKITVEESTPEMTRVKIKYTLGPCLPPFWEGPDEAEMNILQFISPEIKIADKTISSDDAAKSPEKFGFTKSDIQVIDESGNEYTYYTMYLENPEKATDVAKNIQTGSGTADKFLNDGSAEISGGTVVLKVDKASGKSEYQTQLFGDNEKSLLIGTGGGAFISLTAEMLKESAKNGFNRAAGVVGAIGGYFDCETAYHNYDMDLQQIEYSRNSYVLEHKDELKLRTKAVFYSRVLLTATTVGVGLVTAAATAVTCAIGVAVGVAVGIGAYLINKFLLDPIEEYTRKKIYVTSKGTVKAGIDPSGYVYAAVPENRIEGATASIYYKDESGKAVLWNAVDYDQINPMITDSQGGFMWDVPEGMWQVKITAKGYEDYTTEWLPVLPVQTDVNISLKTKSAAELVSIDACSNAVEIKLSQYMNDSTVTSENIYLTGQDGKKLNCKIKLVKSETNDTAFSERILLISDKENIAGSTLHITSGLLNYSGIPTAETVQKITEVKSEYLVDDDDSLGDVNEDGKIDAKDASLVLAAYANMSTGAEDGLTEKQRKAADVNGDGKIDSRDASSILAYYAMLATSSGDIPTMKEFMVPKQA